MNIYRNKKDKEYKEYFLAKVTPPRKLGFHFESEEVISREKRKLNNSSWKLKDFYIIGEK